MLSKIKQVTDFKGNLGTRSEPHKQLPCELTQLSISEAYFSVFNYFGISDILNTDMPYLV